VALSVHAQGFHPAAAKARADEEGLVIKLSRQILVSFRVRVWNAGEYPVGRAMVKIEAGGAEDVRPIVGRTGSDGTVHLCAPPGVYTLTVESPWVPEASATLTLDPDRTPELELR
jgi:hypothetical protein